jgi:hypothetical protein
MQIVHLIHRWTFHNLKIITRNKMCKGGENSEQYPQKTSRIELYWVFLHDDFWPLELSSRCYLAAFIAILLSISNVAEHYPCV